MLSSMFKTSRGQGAGFHHASPSYHFKTCKKMCFLIYLSLSSQLMGEITFVLMRFENECKGKTEFSLIIVLLWHRNHSHLSTKWSPQGKTISMGVIGCSVMCISGKGGKVKAEDGGNSVFGFFRKIRDRERKEGSKHREERGDRSPC